MEQQQRSLFFTAAVGLIILAIIVGSIYYLVKFIQTRVASSRQTQPSTQTVESSGSPQEVAEGEQTPEFSGDLPQTGSVASDNKTYNGGSFQLSFSKNWGVLTCTNSANLELDPANGIDSKIECGSALKPVTIIVDDISGCSGENIKIGETLAVKSKKVEGGYTSYQWCTKTEPVLNITHRVSKGGEKAVSPEDYYLKIEEMISSISFGRGS